MGRAACGGITRCSSDSRGMGEAIGNDKGRTALIVASDAPRRSDSSWGSASPYRFADRLIHIARDEAEIGRTIHRSRVVPTRSGVDSARRGGTRRAPRSRPPARGGSRAAGWRRRELGHHGARINTAARRIIAELRGVPKRVSGRRGEQERGRQQSPSPCRHVLHAQRPGDHGVRDAACGGHNGHPDRAGVVADWEGGFSRNNR